MKLNIASITDPKSRKEWTDKGYRLPEFDIIKMRETPRRIPSGFISAAETFSRSSLLPECRTF